MAGYFSDHDIENCSITVDANNDVFIACSEHAASGHSPRLLILSKNSDGEWSYNRVISAWFTEMGSDHIQPQTLYDPYFKFSVKEDIPPLTFAVDKGDDPSVRFYGKWQEGEEVLLEQSTAIYYINRETDELIVWVQRDEDLEITAFANDQQMDKETEGNEDQFSIQLLEPAEIELKFEMTQPDATKCEGLRRC
ncbi:hypothetical protein JCM19037_511 [Geomicrobium sp. JCM 19037]|nr:hypothetical protein JCM19037_511 [Geomicrobium sp. JCM 19037]